MPESEMSRVPIRRALLSVSDKTGLIDLARGLAALDIELLSTGGTARSLREADIAVRDVSDVTDFPEIMDGRVKTLHPRVHGGLLGRRGVDEAVMEEHAIVPIDLLVANLYPFEANIARPDCSEADAIENIDIGGPAMLRAGAKNHAHVVVVVDPDDYARLLDALAAGGTALPLRRQLAAKAFAHSARYDGMVASWIGARADGDHVQEFAPTLHLSLQRRQTLRYGENPHQSGALYVEAHPPEGSISVARVMSGKAMSYNNIADADAALECVKAFVRPACVIVKHANPCGVAVADDIVSAYERAYQCDATSAFGGIIAFNRELDAQTAQTIFSRQFVEVVIAPSIGHDVERVFAQKPNVRLLVSGSWPSQPAATMDYKRVAGGLLVQSADSDRLTEADLRIVSRSAPSINELNDLLFAWRVAMHVKSNAIVYARDHATIGIGAGQMSRVISAKIAAIKAADAELDISGSVMASDAFFPFRDGIDLAAAAGIRAVIQPGGSMRDDQVIAAADEHGMAMVFTGRRHFRH